MEKNRYKRPVQGTIGTKSSVTDLTFWVIIVGACFSCCVGFKNVYFDFTLPGSYIYVCIKIEVGEIDLHNSTL